MKQIHQPSLIKYALALRDYRQTDVARECAVAPAAVSMVINGRSRSKQVEERIADITGLTLCELWPQWHGPQAKRSRRPVMPAHQVAQLLRAQAG